MVLPARSVVVICTVDGPSGSLALIVYAPEASAWPLALTAPLETVTVENGSVEPLNVAGDVLMRPSSAEASSLSVGMLVSTVKRQSLRTSWRNRLELVATKVTVCGPSASLPVVNVSLSPIARRPGRHVLAVERHAHARELLQTVHVEDHREGLVLDVGVRPRRDGGDPRHAEHLPAEDGHDDEDRRHDDIRPAAAILGAFATIDVVGLLRHHTSSGTVTLRL